MKLTFECDDMTVSLTSPASEDPDGDFNSVECGVLFSEMIRIIHARCVGVPGWIVAAIINYLDGEVFSPATPQIEEASERLQDAAWDLELAWQKHRYPDLKVAASRVEGQ